MKIYEFKNGEAVLDTSDGALRDRSGSLVELRPQSREVLRLLATAPDRVVSRDEFAEAVWDGRNVGSDSLVQCIAEIRAALDDSDRKIIQTVPRKGYRFVPPGEAAARRPGRAMAVGAAVVLLCAAVLGYMIHAGGVANARAPVVAVLPLDDLSPAPHRGYLSDALSEGIITELARFPQFRVIARNSSFRFGGEPTDVREIGEALGAGYVVEGSQQFDGARLRVTVQLVETDTGAHLFSDRYERDLDDLFVVQNDIVWHVASVVGQSILTDMPRRAVHRDVDSRLRGLQARKLMSQFSRENWEKALALEQTSVREEPESAWGYIGTSLMLANAAAMGWMKPADEVLKEATDLAETAMKLDPENYMSHYALARVLSRRGLHDEAILHFGHAAELNPSDSLVLIGISAPLLHSGEADRAIEMLMRAKSVDPLHGDWLRWQLAWAHWQNEDCDKGLEEMQSMNSPPLESSKMLAAILVCLGRPAEAKVALDRFLAARPDHSMTTEAATMPTNWKPEGIADRWLQDMRAAGMPG